jgi:uncharacterized protein (TIGR02246 family)
MKRLARKIGFWFASVIGISAVLLGFYLYQSNREAARFTEELNELEEKGPEVVLIAGVSSNDIQAIQRIYQVHNEAWCEGDGEKYASVFTQEADFISFDGTHATGRDKIALSHQELFDTFLRDTCLRGYIDRIKFLDENVAVAYVRSGTRFDGRQDVQRASIQTFVAVKQNDEWLFSSFHNGRIDRVENWNIFRMIWFGIQTVVFRR